MVYLMDRTINNIIRFTSGTVNNTRDVAKWFRNRNNLGIVLHDIRKVPNIYLYRLQDVRLQFFKTFDMTLSLHN